MSVVAVKKVARKIIIGADSIRVTGYTQEKSKDAKLVRLRDGTIVGTAGYCKDLTLLTVYAETHSIEREVNETKLMSFIVDFIRWAKILDSSYCLGSDFIFITEGRIYLVASDLFMREIEDYYAIGAGADYALSALFLGSSVEKAIEVACELSIYCEKPINVIEVDIDGSSI